MFVVRNYVTMCGTVACALGIGYLMQNGTAAQPNGAQEGVSVASVTGQASVLAGLEGIVLTSSSPSEPASDGPVSTSRTLRPAPVAPKMQANCTINARAMAVASANAKLSIKAPCHGDERINIHHSGLTISEKTDKNGTLNLTIPALSEYAIFLISFEDQTGTVATTHISDVSQYDRVALQWQGETGLQIHALEFGASYGEQGHVWSNTSAQGTGDVVRLGRSGWGNAQNVEVYSFPTGQSNRSGAIALSVEAEVTEANCGRDLSVQSLELRADQRLRSHELSVTLPDCSQAGEFLVLNNLLQDLTIAAK